MQILAKMLKKPITSAFIAIILGFVVAGIVLSFSGYNPFDAFAALFQGMFARPKYISNVIIKSTPVILTGVGIAIAFKVGLFNIGAEGQYILGTIAAVIVGYLFDFNPVIQIPLVVLSGVAAGALWGLITGFLKARFGINEVITSIMLNWIALYLCNYVVNSQVFHAPNTTASYRVNESSYTMILPQWKSSPDGIEALKRIPWLYDTLIRTDMNIGFLVAVVIAVCMSFMMYKTTKGYELRAIGLNSHAAKFSGVNINSNIIQAMLISGAICGLAGALAITGTSPHRISQMVAFEGNGLNGLAVALIARSSPVGCILSGLLFGGLLYGGQSVQSKVGAPTDIIRIMIGVIVLFVALTEFVPVIIDKLKRRNKHAC